MTAKPEPTTLSRITNTFNKKTLREMPATLWCAPVDIHAAHTDPFSDESAIHGHLWRVSVGVSQSLTERIDVRILIAECRDFVDIYDHTHLGCISTEDIATAALVHCMTATMAEVEEVGVCRVVLQR